MIVAFTGHRPTKIGGYDENSLQRLKIKSEISKVLKKLKPDMVITGGALGIDQDAAKVCHKQSIPFTIVIPCINFNSRWPEKSKQALAELLKVADKTHTVHHKTYDQAGGSKCLQDRNEYMVNACDTLIAIWDGSPGGTANCVKYARLCNKEIIKINPKDFE